VCTYDTRTPSCRFVNGNLDAGGLQANLLEAFLAVAQNPSLIAPELMLQPFTDHLVGAQQVGRRDALAIRRVVMIMLLLGRLLEVLEVFAAPR
jgi:hypothetical protein